MASLNYHHLYYFWVVAREGSIVAASRELDLSQPTISSQIRTLEESLGVKLFERAGRGLVLTDTGRVAFRYADSIFTMGREMADALQGLTRRLGRRLGFAERLLFSLQRIDRHVQLFTPAQPGSRGGNAARAITASAVKQAAS